VDHTRYKRKEDEVVEGQDENGHGFDTRAIDDEAFGDKVLADGDPKTERPPLKEELELAALIRDHDDDDPMKAFLIQEKREQISAALTELKDAKDSGVERKSRRQHRHHHHHKSHRSRDVDKRESDGRHTRRYQDERIRPKS
jgi:RNA-binding motif X-linked protein 2